MTLGEWIAKFREGYWSARRPRPDPPPIVVPPPVVMPPPVVFPTPPDSPGTDPTGFIPALNRARHGLSPVVADAALEAWAAVNNDAQRVRGMGHHVFPPVYRRQNVAWNYPDALAVLQGWLSSPPHRAGLLDPAITRAGIAFDGSFWTFNAA
jgi:hypothetical protein